MKQEKSQVKYCVACEAEGVETEATEELDIGFGPAPVCQRHKEEYKDSFYDNIRFIDEHI